MIKANSGQSLVELAISFTILMFLLGGIVEFGIAFFQYVQLRDAAQEGALYGSVCECSEEEIIDRAKASSNSPINLRESEELIVDVLIVDPLGNSKLVEDACEGDAMEVRLVFPHKVFMPFIPKLIGRSEIALFASVVDTVLVPSCQ